MGGRGMSSGRAKGSLGNVPIAPLGVSTKNLNTKTAYYVSGEIKNVKVMAGGESERGIDDIKRLVKEFGGKAKDYRKVTCEAKVSKKGSSKKTLAEIHWYQQIKNGKSIAHNAKIKKWV